MKNEIKHTPLPWKLNLARHKPESPIFGFTITAEGKIPFVTSAGVATPNHALILDADIAAEITTGFTAEEVRANAEFIMRAVNNHDALIEELRDVIYFVEDAEGLYRRNGWSAAADRVKSGIQRIRIIVAKATV